MAYDGMYGDLSTRGTANQILDQILQVQDEVEVTQDEIEATAAAVDASATQAMDAAAAALQSQNDAAAFASAAENSSLAATSAANGASLSAAAAEASEDAAALSAVDAAASAVAAAQSAQDAEDAAASVIIGGPRLMSIAAAVMAVNDMLISDSTSTMTAFATGSVGRLLLASETAATARTNLGATSVGDALFTAVDAAAGRTALGLGTAATATLTTSTEDATIGRVVKVGDFDIGRKLLPDIVGNNETFSFEGGVTRGWSATNMSVASVATGSTTFTKTVAAGGGASQVTRTVNFPQNYGDYIMFGKVSLNNSATDLCAVSIIDTGIPQMSIWFNSVNGGTGANSAGGVSVRGSVAGVTQTASLGNFTLSSGFEFALQYDQKHQTCTAWYKNASTGRWIWGNRIACDRHVFNMSIAFGSSAVLNAAINVEYLSIASPNIVVWGDSIAEGKTLYSPDPALALTNWTSHWASYTNLYQGLRNNLPVIKGVGSRTSLAMESNLGEIANLGAQVVFFHASSNDSGGGVSQSARTTSMQSQIDRLNRAGAKVVLLNAMQGTPTYSGNPALRDYTNLWWSTSRSTLRGVYSYFDIAAAIASGAFQDPALTQADGIHPNPAGYAIIGGLINAALGQFTIPDTRDPSPPIVGTVVQTGGFPYGAIIESGTNGNGSYIKYADGTLICVLDINVTDQAINTAYGSLFQGTRVWTFPATFAPGAISCNCGQFRWGSGASWGTVGSAPSTASVVLRGLDNVTRATGTSTGISATAIGRWF